MENLLAENRSMGWVSAETCPAGDIRNFIIAYRQAALDKKPLPKRMVSDAVELRWATTSHIRRINASPAPTTRPRLSVFGKDGKIHLSATEQAMANRHTARVERDKRITELFAAVKAGRQSAITPDLRVAERYQSGQAEDPIASLRCPASSIVSSREDHRAGAQFHRTLGQRAKTMDEGAAHFAAATEHDACADDDSDSDRCARALAECRKAMQPSAVGQNKGKVGC
jgi:hypothetical protein